MKLLHSLSQVLHRLSSGRVTLVATAVFVVFMLAVLPAQARSSATAFGEIKTPDTLFFYAASDLYTTAAALGDAGRSHYLRARWTFDVMWPLVYLAFLVTSISWLARHGFSPASRWQLANLAPVAAAFFDLLENSATSLIMARFPAPTPVVAELAGVFTALKWTALSTSFAVAGIALIAAAVRWVRVRRTPSPNA